MRGPLTAAIAVLLLGTLGAMYLGSADPAQPILAGTHATAPADNHPSPREIAVAPAILPPATRPLNSSPAVWENLSGGSSPGPRWGASLGYDGAGHRLIMFGGVFDNATVPVRVYNDTWAYQNGTWSNITSVVGAAPAARSEGSMTYDARDGYLVMGGGWTLSSSTGCPLDECQDMWKLTASGWQTIPLPSSFPFPSPREQGRLKVVYDSSDAYVLITDTVSSLRPVATYAYSAGVFTNLTAQANGSAASYAPQVAGQATLADDPNDHGVLLFGGFSATAETNQTWIFRAGAWHNLTANLTLLPPVQGYYPTLDWDNASHADLLYAYQPAKTGFSVVYSTWQFNATWTELTTKLQPPIVLGTLAWDPPATSSIMFGGETSPPNNDRVATITNQTWAWTATPDFQGLTVKATPAPADVGAPVGYEGDFIGGTAPFHWSWSFGDGSNNTTARPTHVYSGAGNYSVTLTVVDSVGHNHTASTTLPVVAAPSAAPAASPNPTDAGLATRFAPGWVGGSGPVNYSWHFGDGTTASTMAPSHVFTKSGNYTVHLWANDSGGGQVNRSFVEKVNTSLSVSVNSTPTNPSLGELVNFSAVAAGGTPPYTYAWSFGDGGSGGNLRNISHIFTTNGPFEAAVVVTDRAGASVTAVDDLTVALNLTLLADWHIGAAPLSVAFHTHVQGGAPGYTYQWSFGDGGLSSAPAPTHSFASPGYYTSVVTVVDHSGQIAQSDWGVLVVPGGGPLLSSVAATPLALAVGQATVLTGSVSGGSGGYAIDWATAGLSCQSIQLLSERCTASRSGSYPVSLTVTDERGNQAVSPATTVTVGAPGGTVLAPAAPNPGRYLGAELEGLGIGVAGTLIALLALSVIRRSGPKHPPTRGGEPYGGFLGAGRPGPDARPADEGADRGGRSPVSIDGGGPDPAPSEDPLAGLL